MSKFTELEFVELLLPLLFKNGIYRMEQPELESRLVEYYNNPSYEELFQEMYLDDIDDHEIQKRVHLNSGLESEEFFGNIWSESKNRTLLNFSYDEDMDLSKLEQRLSVDGKQKMRQIAYELGIREKIEKTGIYQTRIYGINPNTHYLLVKGNLAPMYHQSILFELITDGDIIQEKKNEIITSSQFQTSCYEVHPMLLERFGGNHTIKKVTLDHATYSIKRVLYNGRIRYCTIHTKNFDEEYLKKLVEIANSKYRNDKKSEEPYVKKLILK